MKKCEHPKCENLVKNNKNKFCSRSCSAKINNSKAKKKQKTKKCRECGDLILMKNTFCPKCISMGVHLPNGFLKEKKLSHVIYQKAGSNTYAGIRDNARRVVKNWDKICFKCGYNKHVEVCHKKPINEFSLNSTVGEINSPSNLILLCPNCHWEFDNGLLKLAPSEGIEPTDFLPTV